VFASFYEDLYKSKCPGRCPEIYATVTGHSIPPFVLDELMTAIKRMKLGKARDKSGIAAEMIKLDCPLLHSMILELFNDVLIPDGQLPADWRSSRLVVIFKKGDPKLPGNYRPIAILPILYKLFSRMLCGRLRGQIMREQSVDQAAYRQGFSTEDHLLSTTLLFEQCSEWSVDVWLGLVDFEKAFDTVEHEPLWEALVELGIQPAYVNLLKIMYSSQLATVASGAESRSFNLERGVKQGDPISSFLFIVVMEVVFRRLKARWNQLNKRRSGQYFGMVIDDPLDPLTNLRFADDVLLVACSRGDVGKMIADLAREAGKFGLKLHMGKTRVLTNCGLNRPAHITCCGQQIQVLDASQSERYLGRKLSTDDYHDTELANRVASGWACFFKFKDALCNRGLPLRDRLKLFESCVAPCVLYACCTWTLTLEREDLLNKTRRRMLRWMTRVARQPEEDWVDFITRATHLSEELAASHGSKNWITTHRQRKWQFAGKAATHVDGRWTHRLLAWRPWFRCWPKRSVGHPVRRWSDDIVTFAGGDWIDEAARDGMWQASLTGFIDAEGLIWRNRAYR
jgi:hypothetical protein